MTDEWKTVDGFESYEVCSEGIIRNKDTKRIIKPSLGSTGTLKLNLMYDGKTYTVSASRVVARHFLGAPPRPEFNSLIYKDGDRRNCSADNLAWRSLSFSRRYGNQFSDVGKYLDLGPVTEIETKKVFPSVVSAGVEYGLLFDDIVMSAVLRTVVFPTFQRFDLELNQE